MRRYQESESAQKLAEEHAVDWKTIMNLFRKHCGTARRSLLTEAKGQ